MPVWLRCCPGLTNTWSPVLKPWSSLHTTSACATLFVSISFMCTTSSLYLKSESYNPDDDTLVLDWPAEYMPPSLFPFSQYGMPIMCESSCEFCIIVSLMKSIPNLIVPRTMPLGLKPWLYCALALVASTLLVSSMFVDSVFSSSGRYPFDGTMNCWLNVVNSCICAWLLLTSDAKVPFNDGVETKLVSPPCPCIA